MKTVFLGIFLPTILIDFWVKISKNTLCYDEHRNMLRCTVTVQSLVAVGVS